MEPKDVKKELWKRFGQNDDFLGASVRTQGVDTYVVVKLNSKNIDDPISDIPNRLEDVKITVEYSDPIKAYIL